MNKGYTFESFSGLIMVTDLTSGLSQEDLLFPEKVVPFKSQSLKSSVLCIYIRCCKS